MNNWWISLNLLAYLACKGRRISGHHFPSMKNSICGHKVLNDFCDVQCNYFCFLFGGGQIALFERRDSLVISANLCNCFLLAGLLTVAFETNTYYEWNARKDSCGGRCCILSRTKCLVAKEKINVFGKSALDIPFWYFDQQRSICVEWEKRAIFCMKCYDRPIPYKNAICKGDEIEE